MRTAEQFRRLHLAGALFAAIALAAATLAQSRNRPATSRRDGARLLDGAVDIHLHVDPDTEGVRIDNGTIAILRAARERGLRGVVLKNHSEPTATLAYLVRKEIPGLMAYGGIDFNLTVKGINAPFVDYRARFKGGPGQVVWMPTSDSEHEARASGGRKKSFVSVSRNGSLLPEVKEAISRIAAHRMTLATGHSSPEEDLMLVREARAQGVEHVVVTHPMDRVLMSIAQMQEAVRLGALLEFDMRSLLDAEHLQAVRVIGPEFCIVSQFWTPSVAEHATSTLRAAPGAGSQYAALDGMSAFAAAMRRHGFTERELDWMFKDNPAKLLGLPPRAGVR